MDALTIFHRMADYNAWFNDRLYATVEQLSHDDLWRDRGAFFKSVGGTLNHVMVGDRLWLSRFAAHPAAYPALEAFRVRPAEHRLDEVLYTEFNDLRHARRELDAVIGQWCSELESAHLDEALAYRNSKGVAMNKPFGLLVAHFFNHQTHHRGQVTTLLSQAGLDVGVTDLLARIPDVESD